MKISDVINVIYIIKLLITMNFRCSDLEYINYVSRDSNMMRAERTT